MYLKKLEMLGFKSFADRTEFLFQRGMTAVVGPNGCGKSNVVDAFKWIFGEQSAKVMRGTEMKDVIFNGTHNRKPTGFAEVTIAFENSDRFLDIDYAEVAITRRLFRSGESEYLINKQKARLKDIRELFMGTGVGQTSYSILEQGKIDVLLQSSNVERRSIFEEAAGISKYLARKAEALRALLRVEDNLTRLNDIIDEVRKRLNRVKAQASKARRHRTLSERLKEVRIRLTLDEYRVSRESRVNISFRLYWCNLRIRNLEERIEEMSGACREKSAERQGKLESLKKLREALGQEQAVIERTRERTVQGRHRLADLGAERERRAEDLEATLTALQRIREELEGERQELAACELDIAGKREACTLLATQLEDRKIARGALESEVRDGKRGVVALMQEASRLGNSMAALDAEIGNLKAQRDRIDAALQEFRSQSAAAGQQIVAQQGELEALAERRNSAAAELAGVASAEAEIEKRLEETGRELSGVLGRLHQCTSRFEVLRSLEEKFEGIGRGVADVLRGKDTMPELGQVHGMVATFVQVESTLARAVEAALGVRAQSLLVETQEGALRLLDFARKENVGAIEAISLDRVDAAATKSFPPQAGVLGALRERVVVPEEFADLFDRLLANVVLVEDFDTALALSRNGLRPFRLVTLQGELIEPWGALSTAGKSELGIISRRSEMDGLEKERRRLEEDQQRLGGLQEGMKRELAERRAQKDRLREDLGRLDRTRVQVQGSVEQLEREVDRLSREIRVGSSELAEAQTQIGDRQDERKELAAKAGAVGEEISAAEERIRLQEEELAVAVEAESAAVDRLTEARLALAQAEKSEEGLRELLARRETALGERQARVESLGTEIETLAARLRQTEEEIQRGESELEAALKREARYVKELEGEDAVDGALVRQEQSLHRALEALHRRHAGLQDDLKSAQLREQEERHRRNTLVERIDEEYGIDIGRLLEMEAEVLARHEANDAAQTDAGTEVESAGAPESDGAQWPCPECRYLLPDPQWDKEAAREEIRAVQEKIRRLGAVNLEALDELKELEERHKFQQAQRDDLVESEKNLRGIIGEINKTSRELFLKTFEEVQGHFSDLFRKCFGGGKAELVLEDGVDVLEAGVDIVARPPGKKITRLSLMSGGEKTMTTIALLFAIFRARPSPFCILDEVDAPLDEANVRRFVVLLQDFLGKSQFIVITHNKSTMAEAGTLYGVTMQERGVSKRVSVELSSYDPEKMEAAAAR